MNFTSTKHNAQRMSQRSISEDDLAFVLTFGQVHYRTGAKFVFLGRRDVPAAYRRSHGHLEGLTVVMKNGNVVLTCYRNKEALGNIKRKRKNSAKPQFAA